MAEELKIIVDADVSKAREGIGGFANDTDQLVDGLKKMPPAAAAAGASLDKLGNSANTVSGRTEILEKRIITLNQIIGKTDDYQKLIRATDLLNKTQSQLSTIKFADSLKKVGQAATAAQIPLINIGRVFQDLPFGILGVSNNINPLIESFQRLRQESGSTQGAFRALLQGLAGGGGLGLAFSVITGALTFLTVGLSAFTRGLSSNKDEVDSSTGTLKNYESQLEAVKKAVDSLRSSLDFGNELGALNAEIAKIPKSIDLQGASVAQREFTQSLIDQQQKIKDALDLLEKDETLTNDERLKQQQSFNDELDDLQKQQVQSEQKQIIIFRQIRQQQIKEQEEQQGKSLESTKAFIEKAKRLQDELADFKFERITLFDTIQDQLKKAQLIFRQFQVPTFSIDIPIDVKVPKTVPAEFDKLINDFAKRLTVPLQTALDQHSLLQTEDQIKQIFSGFSDTNIFTEFGRQAGTKFRDALLKSVQDLQKGFTINPSIDTTDIINSLTSSLAGIKDIQLKVIKGEDFNSAIRTLRDLHDAGVAAGEAVEKAFLAAGRSSEDAAKAGETFAKGFHGITQETENIAKAIDNTLTPAFSNLFDAILEGKNPVKAFFESIGKSIEDLASKLIGAEIEKAILGIIGVSSTATTAIQATTIATEAAAASGAAAAATAAAAAAGAGVAATAASAAATAAIIAAAAAKAASAAINPLSLLGFLGLGFAEGGRPPVGETVMVGERGPELMKFDRPGTIYSHSDTVSMLSTASVKQNESIKEYFAEARVLQQLKTHFTELIRPIQATVNNISSTHEKISSFSYKLHENVKSLKESFVSSVSSLITNNDKEVNDSSVSNSIEKLQKSLLTVNNSKVSNSNTLLEATQILKESLSSEVNNNTSSLINKAVEKIAESLVINNTEVSKSTEQNNIASLITRSIEHLKESSNKFSSVKYSIEKLQSFDKSEKSVTIERIINNNFFTESISSSFKSMSLERLQKMFNIPAFATGGAVFGPTLAILGEGFGISRSNPEFVGTANQLQNVTGGQFDLNLTLNGSLETTGDKLWTFLNRTSKTHLRTTGKKPL